MSSDAAAQRLTELWLAYQPVIARYAHRRLDHATADDVITEVFTVAWQRLDQAPPEPRYWLLAIARNVVLNHQRSAGRRAALAELVAAQVQPPDSSVEDLGIDRVDLVRAWQVLTEAEREVLALVVWDGLSAAAAAKLLGIARPAFSVRLLRARRHFLALADGDSRVLPASPVAAPVLTTSSSGAPREQGEPS